MRVDLRALLTTQIDAQAHQEVLTLSWYAGAAQNRAYRGDREADASEALDCGASGRAWKKRRELPSCRGVRAIEVVKIAAKWKSNYSRDYAIWRRDVRKEAKTPINVTSRTKSPRRRSRAL